MKDLDTLEFETIEKKMRQLGTTEHPPYCRCSHCYTYLTWLKGFQDAMKIIKKMKNERT